MVDLSRFVQLAKELNDKSDSLNTTIKEINTKLATLNLGVEAWHGGYIEKGPLKNCADPDTGAIMHLCDAAELGYARIEDEWQLAIRELVLGDRAGDEAYEETLKRTVPLTKCSRTIRAAALGALPQLFERLEQKTKDVLNDIATGEKVAESLR